MIERLDQADRQSPARSPGLGHRMWRPLWLLGGSLLLLATARLLPSLPIGPPPCGLRTLTGLPCPLCGSTRALIALSQFSIVDAFRFNPLVTAGCALFAAWLVVYSAGRWSGREWGTRFRQRLGLLPWLWIAAAAIIANWIYLFLHLPE